jgi:hypothetical protein
MSGIDLTFARKSSACEVAASLLGLGASFGGHHEVHPILRRQSSVYFVFVHCEGPELNMFDRENRVQWEADNDITHVPLTGILIA